MAHYEIWYLDPLGGKLALIPNVGGFSYVKVLGDVGLIQFNTPIRNLVHEANNPDYRIAIYRQPNSGTQQLEVVGFLDQFSYSTDQGGLSLFSAGASDPNDLLRRKINAYDSGDAFSLYNDAVGTTLWELFRQNVAGNAGTVDPARELEDFGISNNGDTGLGDTINIQTAWKNVLIIAQDMQAFSKQAGTEVFFATVATSESTIQFQVSTGQPGSDRTLSTGHFPAVFSLERGNLLNPELTYDYINEANYIYAGGKGQEDERNVQEAENTTSTGRSPFARKERFVSAISGVLDNSDDQVQAKANEALEKYRSLVNLTATITSTPSLEYGKDWFFGDKVTVDYAGFQFDTIIRAVQVQVNSNGKETISARVELTNE